MAAVAALRTTAGNKIEREGCPQRGAPGRTERKHRDLATGSATATSRSVGGRSG